MLLWMVWLLSGYLQNKVSNLSVLLFNHLPSLVSFVDPADKPKVHVYRIREALFRIRRRRVAVVDRLFGAPSFDMSIISLYETL